MAKGSPKRFTAPWSTDGWFAEQQAAKRDPEIYRVIEQAGRGKVDPLGFRGDSPALAVTPATHNPYLALPLVAMFVAVGLFLFGKLHEGSLIGAILALAFFSVGAAVLAFMNLRRIPAWHRARRDVRRYIAIHGGAFPQELRWFN